MSSDRPESDKQCLGLPLRSVRRDAVTTAPRMTESTVDSKISGRSQSVHQPSTTSRYFLPGQSLKYPSLTSPHRHISEGRLPGSDPDCVEPFRSYRLGFQVCGGNGRIGCREGAGCQGALKTLFSTSFPGYFVRAEKAKQVVSLHRTGRGVEGMMPSFRLRGPRVRSAIPQAHVL